MESNELATKITRLSLDRRVTMFVLFLTILAVGLIAITRLQLELFPEGFEGYSLSVRVPWRSAVPQEVMEKIAQPLEEELNTVRGVDSMTASCSSSSASVYLRFKQGTDMDVAYREVRDRVERAKLRFPEDVEYTYIYKMDMSGIPVCMIGMAYDVPPEVDLYDFVNKKIVIPLTRIDGVANVAARGLDEKEIIIEIDKAKSEAYGLDIYTLSRKLRGDNFNLASGNVQDGGKKYLLKSTSTYHTIDQLRNLPISTNVILSDVAVLKYEPEERRYVTRVNSKKAMAITVTKESTANTVAVCDLVVAEMERACCFRPSHVHESGRHRDDPTQHALHQRQDRGVLCSDRVVPVFATSTDNVDHHAGYPALPVHLGCRDVFRRRVAQPVDHPWAGDLRGPAGR